MFIGISLIVLSVILFLQKFGIITGNFWEYLWPTVLLAIGVAMVWGKSK